MFEVNKLQSLCPWQPQINCCQALSPWLCFSDTVLIKRESFTLLHTHTHFIRHNTNTVFLSCWFKRSFCFNLDSIQSSCYTCVYLSELWTYHRLLLFYLQLIMMTECPKPSKETFCFKKCALSQPGSKHLVHAFGRMTEWTIGRACNGARENQINFPNMPLKT